MPSGKTIYKITYPDNFNRKSLKSLFQAIPIGTQSPKSRARTLQIISAYSVCLAG